MNAKIDISNIVINTERLVLRAFRESDLQDFFDYASVDGVGQMAGWKPHENIDISKRILDSFIQEKKTFALVYKANNKVIGSLGIEEYKEKYLPELDDKRGREIGFVLSKEYWGQGLMPEAVNAVIDYCFNTLNLDFLTCGYFLGNTRSKRVQEKCGFTPIKQIQYTTRMGTTEECMLNILYR